MYKHKYEKYKLKYNSLLQQGGGNYKTYYISLIPKNPTVNNRLRLFHNYITNFSVNNLVPPLHITLFKITVNLDTTNIDDDFMKRVLQDLYGLTSTINFTGSKFDIVGIQSDFVALLLNMTNITQQILNSKIIELLNNANIKGNSNLPIKNNNNQIIKLDPGKNVMNTPSPMTLAENIVENYETLRVIYNIGSQRKLAYWIHNNILIKPHISLYRGSITNDILRELTETFNPAQTLNSFKLRLSWGSKEEPHEYILE